MRLQASVASVGKACEDAALANGRWLLIMSGRDPEDETIVHLLWTCNVQTLLQQQTYLGGALRLRVAAHASTMLDHTAPPC